MRARVVAAIVLLHAVVAAPCRAQELCDAEDIRAATTAAPPRSAATARAFEAALATQPQLTPDLLLVGDSLAHRWPPALFSPPRTARPWQLANFGSGGARTEHVLRRLEAAGLARLRPRRVLLVLGTNNFGAGHAACATVIGLSVVIARLRALWPLARLWVLEIPPRGDMPALKAGERLAINAGLRARPDLATVAVDALLPCETAGRCRFHVADRLHINATGYRRLTARVLGRMSRN